MFTVNLKPKWFHLTPDVTYPIDYSPEGKSYFFFEDGEVCIRNSYYTHGINGFHKKNDQQLSVALSKAILTVLGYAEIFKKPTFISLSMALYSYISSYLCNLDDEIATNNVRISFECVLDFEFGFNESDVIQLSSNFHYICLSFKEQYLKGFTSDNYEILKELDLLPDPDVAQHMCEPPPTYYHIEKAYASRGDNQQGKPDRYQEELGGESDKK